MESIELNYKTPHRGICVCVCEAGKIKKKRIFTKNALKEQVENLKKEVAERRLIGELGPPTDLYIHISNASHIVTDLYMDEDRLMARIEPIHTPSGEVLKRLINEGVKIEFRMSGIVGNFNTNDDGVMLIESYKLVQIYANT